jgi:hypothetical protein
MLSKVKVKKSIMTYVSQWALDNLTSSVNIHLDIYSTLLDKFHVVIE